MVTKRDAESMLRAAENGYPVDLDALDAPFNLTITSIASVDVDVEPIVMFSQRLKDVVREAAFSCELTGIVIFPTVLNPEMRSAGNKVTWKRGERAYMVRQNIDFSDWQNANASEKKAMVVNCIVGSIARIPTKHLSESSKEALVEIVRRAVRSGRVSRKAGAQRKKD